MGILSEAGCPAVADPGANLVALAHRHGYEVRPLIGPSSLLLALMASGANGQNFAFKGYLPSEKSERIAALKSLEQRSSAKRNPAFHRNALPQRRAACRRAGNPTP